MRIAIIGGYGRMGRWFARHFLEDDKEVIISGRNHQKLLEASRELGGVETASNVEAVKQADVVIISVPIDNFEDVVKEISPHTRPQQTIADITSIKTTPVEIMHKHVKSGTVLGTHPMFGPGAKSLKNQNFILTPTNDDEMVIARKAMDYLEARGARGTVMTPAEHDEAVAIILGLSHFIAIVSADTLLNMADLNKLRQIAGTTYKVLLTLINGVVSRDPDFYATLQMSLPRMTEVEEAFQRSANTWTELVRDGNKPEFIHRMNALREKFKGAEPDFEQAYENMYKLVEGL